MSLEEYQKRPIKAALDTLSIVKSIGFDGLRAFTLRNEQPKFLEMNEDETKEEVIDRMSSICCNGQEYFRMWLGDENVTYVSTRCDVKTYDDILDLTKLDDGVYYMEFAGCEFHYWVFVILEDNIWYAGTYGGVNKVTIESFNKVEYNKRWKMAMAGSIKDYEYVFQVDAAQYYVGLEYLEYSKSERYY